MKKRVVKTIQETACEDQFYEIEWKDLNPYGTLAGHVIVRELDKAAAVVAKHHSGRVCVTRHVESSFVAPAYIGEKLVFKISINGTWSTSMEVGVQVHAVDHVKCVSRYIGWAYLSFVALDDMKHPVQVPDIICQSAEEQRRYREATERQNFYRRKDAKEKTKKKQLG